ncbi:MULTISPECIES: twin-arginine translocase TatA/TatE family subunit [Pelosinus]|uniref:Sec-independent protein translocase protein TatA n=2 Tax=Pelosinus TaxID=365348 RepID=I9DMV1_9FIRM|nr:MULTISPECIES: twin-arginine translocase TatA/TatE family subunit [Pelosinus]AJQ26990.1 Sec-independent protein translocase protein tatA/E-like protein [Pelosinus fermentans JBW45]MCC5465596.1 twin-arginine translocase TatA/TatE family subunit [Pelosinus baikalensis]
MFSFSMPELVLILVIALVVFGPGKLPEVGKALGRGIQEFKKATTGEIKQDPIIKEESKTEEKK